MAKEALKRAPDVLKENKDWVIAHWLERVNANHDLTRVSLSEAERSDHVPDLLDDAVDHACGNPVDSNERQRAAERHGTLRYHQGYSIPMLISEARLLQEVIAECIRDNFFSLDLGSLMLDIAKITATITAELEESSRAYMKQFEWRSTTSSDPQECP